MRGSVGRRLLGNGLLVVLASLENARADGRLPKALLVNLPRHQERFQKVKQQLDGAGVNFERANAVDGKMLTPAELKADVTLLARWLITRGMVGCFLSHRACWQRCVDDGKGPILVFEDDVILADNFTASLTAALDKLPDDWDVLMLGALGAVHPSYYACNLLHAMMAGGIRYPKGSRQAFSTGDGEVAIHVPMRPFGTHAYAISERGARKLLAAAPRANYHVDMVAWGVRHLRLFAVHPLLAKQTHDDTTIGGKEDRSYLPDIVIDPYTGTDFAWAWNAPLLQVWAPRGVLITIGRAVGLSLLGFLVSYLLRSKVLLCVTLGWAASLYLTLAALTWPQWWHAPWSARRELLPAVQPAADTTVSA